jgi:hypothetical protein
MDEPGRYTGRSNYRGFPPPPPAPHEPSPVQPAGSTTCVFCDSPETIWQHDLDPSLSRWRDEYDYGMTWGTPLALCDDCEMLWNQSEYWRLTQRQLASAEDGFERSVEHRLLAIAAFCRADRGSRRQP